MHTSHSVPSLALGLGCMSVNWKGSYYRFGSFCHIPQSLQLPPETANITETATANKRSSFAQLADSGIPGSQNFSFAVFRRGMFPFCCHHVVSPCARNFPSRARPPGKKLAICKLPRSNDRFCCSPFELCQSALRSPNCRIPQVSHNNHLDRLIWKMQ